MELGAQQLGLKRCTPLLAFDVVDGSRRLEKPWAKPGAFSGGSVHRLDERQDGVLDVLWEPGPGVHQSSQLRVDFGVIFGLSVQPRYNARTAVFRIACCFRLCGLLVADF